MITDDRWVPPAPIDITSSGIAGACCVLPRALTTTLFLRTFIADLFIHGIGGGQYDRLTDRIVETVPPYHTSPVRHLAPQRCGSIFPIRSLRNQLGWKVRFGIWSVIGRGFVRDLSVTWTAGSDSKPACDRASTYVGFDPTSREKERVA